MGFGVFWGIWLEVEVFGEGGEVGVFLVGLVRFMLGL